MKFKRLGQSTDSGHHLVSTSFQVVLDWNETKNAVTLIHFNVNQLKMTWISSFLYHFELIQYDLSQPNLK